MQRETWNMRNENLTVRYLKRSDTPELITFLELCYKPKYVLADKKFLEWYLHPPRVPVESDVLPILGAFLDGKLVGHMFVIPHYFNNRSGEKAPMVWNSNFMVHPSLQQKGVGPAIVRAIFDDTGIAVSAGTGASLQEKGGRSLLTAMGYNFAFMKKYVAPLEKIPELPESGSPRGAIEDVTQFDERMDEFWKRVWAPRFFGTWRDADFMNWRYIQHPVFKYRARAIYDETGKMRGVAVFRLAVVRPTNAVFGRITEFLAEENFTEPLLRDMLAIMKAEKAYVADFFVTTPSFDETLQRVGFVSDPELTERVPRLFDPVSDADPFVNIIAKNLRGAHFGEEFNSFDNWYATAADGDQDRPNSCNV